MELSSKYEKLLVTLLATANKGKLKHLVDNNNSLIEFALNHPEALKVRFWMSIVSPFIDADEINAERVMVFLQKTRPDIAQIVNLNWIRNQIEEFKKWKNG